MGAQQPQGEGGEVLQSTDANFSLQTKMIDPTPLLGTQTVIEAADKW